MTGRLVRRVANRLTRIFGVRRAEDPPADLWDRRAREYGARAVFNLAHTENQLAHVTEMQKRAIYPHVRAALRHDERLALDFGCGPGRFTADLAKLIGGRAIGVDTTRTFIDMAPVAEGVEYRMMNAGRIPLTDGAVDLLWICLVLGGIVDGALLERSLRELDRVLRPGALLVVVENTSKRPDVAHWKYRSVDDYRRLITFADLEHKGDYDDAGEQISIMVGRKKDATAPDRDGA